MTRGYKPVVAIGEARRRAQVRGFVLIAVETDIPLPFDFVIRDGDCISLVRVRRLKYAQYDTADILRLCAQEIVELRQVPVTDEILRELWVRGPGRDWHRYLVLRDGIEPIRNEGGSSEGRSQEPGSPPMDQGTPQPTRQPEKTGLPENTGQPELTGLPEHTGVPENTGLPDHTW